MHNNKSLSRELSLISLGLIKDKGNFKLNEFQIEEIVEERNQYFRDKTNTQMEAVDRDLMKESNPAMPISKDRKSQVAFGGKRQS